MDNNLIVLQEREFTKKFNLSCEYFCEITDRIDEFSVGFKSYSKMFPDEKNMMRSYLIDPINIITESTRIPIRVPGLTIGCIDVTRTDIGYHIDRIQFYKTNTRCLIGDYYSLENKFNGKYIIYPNIK